MPDDPEPQQSKELDLTVAGQHIRAKGYRLLDLLWIAMVCAGGYYLYQHDANAQAERANVATAVKEANAAVVSAIKETSERNAKAIEKFAEEQKRATSAMREIACLSDPSMRNKQDAREFCKRMSNGN